MSYDPNDFDGPPNPNAIRIEPSQPQEIVKASDGSLDPLVMTDEDRLALNTDYKKGEVNREEAAMYRSLLR